MIDLEKRDASDVPLTPEALWNQYREQRQRAVVVESDLTTLRAKLAKAERRYEKLKGSKRFHAACSVAQGLAANKALADVMSAKGHIMPQALVDTSYEVADLMLSRLGEDAGEEIKLRGAT